MVDKIIEWAIKRLVFLWDRHDDVLAFSFSRGKRKNYPVSGCKRKDYSVLVKRYFDDFYTVGTAMYPYPKHEQPREEGE